MKDDAYELHAHLCGIFSNPKRLEILDILREKELSVSDILKRVHISKTNLSQHLAIMKDRGVLKSSRKGQRIYYSVANAKVIEAYDLMKECLKELMSERMGNLEVHNEN